jgi:hypothetical protein
MRPAIASSVVVLTSIVLGACANNGSTALLTTGSVNPSAVAAPEHPTRSKPAVAGRPARVFVMVGFKQKDCAPIAPDIKVTRAPSKGAVSLQPNQMTTVQFSETGKCTGLKLPGTGIYYTARAGESGADSFTIEATTPSGEVASRTFNIRVVQ